MIFYEVWQRYKYRKVMDERDLIHPERYASFMERQFEEGEPMSPVQHLLLLEQDLKRYHMKGAI